MHSFAINSLWVLSVICGFAAIGHFFAGIVEKNRPSHRIHFLFTAMCLSITAFGITLSQTYQAQSIEAYVSTLRLNINFILIFGILFPWYISEFTNVRAQWWLRISTVVLFILWVINWLQPYTVQFVSILKIEQIRLPWGETIAQPVGKNGFIFFFASMMVLANLGYGIFAFYRSWRQQRKGTSLAMLLAVMLYLFLSIEGILVRASVINFIHLGPYGNLLLAILMSVVLRFEMQQRLATSEQRFRSLVEQSPFSIQVLTPDGLTRQVNPAWEKLWNIKAESLGPYNILQDAQLVKKGIMPFITQGFAGKATEIPPIIYNPAENPVLQGPLNNRWVRAFIYPIKNQQGALEEVILMHEDVTERKKIEDAIHLIAAGVSATTGEEFFRQLVLNLAKLIDADYAFVGALDEQDDQQMHTLASCAHAQLAPNFVYALAGTPCANVVGKTTCIYAQNVQHSFPEDPLLIEMGANSYIGTPLFDAQGKAMGIVVVLHSKPFENIELARKVMEIFAARASAEMQRTRAEERMRTMAYRDYLTGLPNRAHAHEQLSNMLRDARRTSTNGALLLIDLDHFKTINDALGHDIGDEVLRAVARRLNEFAADGVYMARLGGDEFVALMKSSMPSTEAAEQTCRNFAESIVKKLTSPVFVGERAFTVGASIGIALFPTHGENELDVLRHADMALYRAKNCGRGTTVVSEILCVEVGLRNLNSVRS